MRSLLSLVCFVLSGATAAADQSQFPYPVVEVSGRDALSEWERLRQQGGTPIILGDLSEYEGYVASYAPEYAEFYPDTPQDILERADSLTFPDALYDFIRATHALHVEWMREGGEDAEADAFAAIDPTIVPEEMIGRVPLLYAPSQTPLGYIDYATNLPAETVFIAILPTENPWEAPAYLRWGGWNANPSPEIHVVALKDWHDRYSAVPLVMSHDVMELYAPAPPTDIEEAIALAKLHFFYCEDLIYQGLPDIATLAADRMRTPYWYFWWD